LSTSPVSDDIQSAPLTETPPVRRLLPKEWRDRIDRFDATADGLFDFLRGHPLADRSIYLATDLADWSLLWHLVAVTRGLTSNEKANEAFRLSSGLGAETVLVNVMIKSFFRRNRPTWDQPRAFRIRRPRSSSFPSGHASSAFMAATLLGEDDPLAPVYYALATVVACSRIYVKIHHASDVVAGAALGLVLGHIGRRVWPKGEPLPTLAAAALGTNATS
jgi:undecaprenyl-diphosphatase